jgi:hypothetical protein
MFFLHYENDLVWEIFAAHRGWSRVAIGKTAVRRFSSAAIRQPSKDDVRRQSVDELIGQDVHQNADKIPILLTAPSSSLSSTSPVLLRVSRKTYRSLAHFSRPGARVPPSRPERIALGAAAAAAAAALLVARRRGQAGRLANAITGRQSGSNAELCAPTGAGQTPGHWLTAGRD